MTISSDPACFVTLQSAWLELLKHSTVSHVFQTPQFQAAWYRHFGGNKPLQVFTEVDVNQKLIGVFALYESAPKMLHVLGSKEVSDYLDFVIDRDVSDRAYESFMQQLHTSSWQQLSCLSLPEQSPTLTKLPGQKEVTQQDVCPVIDLPKTWEEYLTSIGKKQRHEIKRKWKNLEERTQATFVVVENAEQIDVDSEDFIRLHKASSPSKAAFWDDAQVGYFKEITQAAAENGWLKLYFLEVDGVRSATMLCFDFNNTFYLYNSGYDPAQFANLSVGNVLTSYTIKHAIELGRDRYDFLRGNEEYKLRFRAVPHPIYDMTLKIG